MIYFRQSLLREIKLSLNRFIMSDIHQHDTLDTSIIITFKTDIFIILHGDSLSLKSEIISNILLYDVLCVLKCNWFIQIKYP